MAKGGQYVKLPSKIRDRQLRRPLDYLLKGDNPSMYIPIGSGDQDAAYYERERPSGSYSKSLSHLILRAFSDRAHSIDLQRKGSQIVPLSKSRHATSNFKTGQ